MTTQKYLVLIVFTLISNFLFAQQGKIVGKVISAKTGEVLIGATVSIKGNKKTTQTDQNGGFSISGLNPGEYSLECSYVSYASKSIPNIKINAGEAITLDVVLEILL